MPRLTRAFKKAIGWDDDMIKVTGDDALWNLMHNLKFPEAQARRILNIAWEFQNKAEAMPGGYVHVYYHGEAGKPATDGEPLWSVVEHLGPVARKWGADVASPSEKAYTEGDDSNRPNVKQRKDRTMPPRRTRAAAPAPEPETVDGVSKLDNVQKYLDSGNTPTLTDYADWFTDNVADPTQISADRLIGLAVTFYGEFQASDYNKEQKAARKAARETSAAANGNGEAAPATTSGRRGARTAAAAPAAGKPATGKRARGRTTAASGADVY